jgi:cell division protein FtsI (penicillin-binding protein 3)
MPTPATAGSGEKVVQAAIRESEPAPDRESRAPSGTEGNASDQPLAPAKNPVTGTVVLDVEQGGIEVPSFVGKTVRAAVETAEDAGLELEAVGSGVARQQSPPPGTHVAAGTNVTVQFGR